MSLRIEKPQFESFESETEFATMIAYLPDVASIRSPYLNHGSADTFRPEVYRYFAVGNLFECRAKNRDFVYRILPLTHIIHPRGIDVILVIDEMLSNGEVKRSFHIESFRDERTDRNLAGSLDPQDDFLGFAADALCRKLGLDSLFDIKLS